jgi:lysophospholipase L1-like esterase
MNHTRQINSTRQKMKCTIVQPPMPLPLLPLLSLAASASAAGSAPHAHDRCRIHTDAASKWSSYRWRNAYVPAAAVAQAPRPAFRAAPFVTHEFAYCSLGKGPWAWGASNVTVAECEAQCTAMNCTCFDYMCPYHAAANCTCPELPVVTPTPSAKKVACVGDSITAGYLSSCGLNYPNQLQQELGSGYHVTNYGVGGQTMFKQSHLPANDRSSYWTRPEYTAVLNSSADVIVLMLGTNDAKANRWQMSSSVFPSDYADMLASFKSMPSKPKVFVMVPPPLYRDGVYGMNQTVINTIFPGTTFTTASVISCLNPDSTLQKRLRANCRLCHDMPPPRCQDMTTRLLSSMPGTRYCNQGGFACTHRPVWHVPVPLSDHCRHSGPPAEQHRPLLRLGRKRRHGWLPSERRRIWQGRGTGGGSHHPIRVMASES